MNSNIFGFVRVPRTGGTFLSMQTLPHIRDYVGENSKLIHMSTSKVESLVQEGTPLFTMLRDPYERSCSEYYYIKRMGVSQYIKQFGRHEEICHQDKIEELAKINITNIYATRLYSIYKYDMSIEDYLEYLGDCPIYPRFFDTKTPKDFDFVGITSEMKKTLDLVKNIYGFKLGSPHFNKNDNKKLEDFYKTGFSRSTFESNNPLEYELYYEGLQRFRELCKENSIS